MAEMQGSERLSVYDSHFLLTEAENDYAACNVIVQLSGLILVNF